MIYAGDKVLVQDRVDTGWSGIAFPGGHVELDEPITKAAEREVFEETVLVTQEPRLCGVKNVLYAEGRRCIVLLFRTCNFAGILKASEEGQVSWVNRADLHNMKLCSTMEELFPVFLRTNILIF